MCCRSGMSLARDLIAQTVLHTRQAVKHSLVASLIWLALVAPAAADLAAALKAYDNGDYAKAGELLLPLAAAEEAGAQFTLGEMALKGQGGLQDFKAATDWFEKAAVNGHPQAMAKLGSLTMLGLGTKPGAKDGYYWLILSVIWVDGPLRQAAMAGLGEAAPQLTGDEKQAIAGPAVRAWRRQ